MEDKQNKQESTQEHQHRVEDDSSAPQAQPQADEAASTQQEMTPEETIQALQEEINKLTNLWLRAKADAENAAKKAQRDVKQAHLFGIERFAVSLLEVKDSLERSLDNLQKRDTPVDNQSSASESQDSSQQTNEISMGIELTLKQLATAFEKAGIQQCDPVEQNFDPKFHEAMQIKETNDVPPNTVLQVIQKGYILNERLIRPALVVVSKAISQEETKPTDASKAPQT